MKQYQTVLEDPIGYKAVVHQEHYDGAGRFVSHFVTKFWFDHVPKIINKLIQNPVKSLFYSSSLFVLVMQLLFIVLAVLYSRGTFKSQKPLIILLIALMASVIIQLNSFYHNVGIIDRSITYVFFYIFPVLMFLIYLYPFYRYHNSENPKNLNWLSHLGLILLGFLICFSGPLIQPIIIISFLIYAISYFAKGELLTIKTSKSLFFHFLFLFVIAVYAFYVSRFNSEADVSVSLSTRYLLMINGFCKILVGKLAWGLILIGLTINLFIIKRRNKLGGIKGTIVAILLFLMAYIFLLPLGGYRSYRPLIIRYDTFLPATLSVIFLLLYTACICYHSLKNQRHSYIAGMFVFILLLANADLNYKNTDGNCQKEVLYSLADSNDKQIIISPDCNILSWKNDEIIHNKELLRCLNVSLRKWEIIDSGQSVHLIRH